MELGDFNKKRLRLPGVDPVVAAARVFRTREIAVINGTNEVVLGDGATVGGIPLGSGGGGGGGSAAGTVATRTAMAALTPALGSLIYLTEFGREGWFCLKNIGTPTDPAQGLFVQTSNPNIIWCREWDGTHGRPEWFGAISNVASADNRAAFDACVALCPVTMFGAVDYYIQDVWIMDRSNRHLVGSGSTGSAIGYGINAAYSMGLKGNTRIILSGTKVLDATVMQFGKTFSATDDTAQMRNSSMTGIAFCRDCTVANSNRKPRPSLDAAPANCIKGVILSFFSGCRVEDCSSFDNPVGFHVFGVVISDIINCKAWRYTEATSASNDFWVGWLVGGYGAANFGYIGVNASVYFWRCRAFDEAGAFATSYGMKLYGRFADTFVIDFEMARMNYGIEIDGKDIDGTMMSNATKGGISYVAAQQDVSIIRPVIDGCSDGGIYIHDTHDWFLCDIDNPYISSSNFCLKLIDSHGNTSLTGGKLITGGIHIENTNGFTCNGTKVRDSSSPSIYMKNAVGCHVQLHAFQWTTPAAAVAVLDDCARVRLQIGISGAPARVTYGVRCFTTSNCSVDGTAIDLDCFVTNSAAQKVRYEAGDARTAFGSNVLVGSTG